MNRGGAENSIMNYYRKIDREKIQFDFLLTEQSHCDFEDEILSLGGMVFRVPLMTIANPWSYLVGVYNFLKEHPEYIIVHSHTSSKSFFPLAIAKMCNIPVRISHSHGSKTEKGYKGIIRDILKKPLKLVVTDMFACGEQAALWLYGQNALNNPKVKLIRNVIIGERFEYNYEIRNKIRKQWGISNETFVIGQVARFHPVKNHLFTIDVFYSLLQKYSQSVLLLLGDGLLHDEIIKKIQDYGIADKIIMPGVVPNVWDYEQAMDIFMLPSINEGLPLSLIEAQIAGLHCFASTGVPQEGDITGNVSFLPLKEGPEKWSSMIMLKRGYKRRGYIDLARTKGYDASTTAILLQNFYLDKVNRH